MSIEDITEEVMRVEKPQRSKRYWEMITVAKEYFSLLRSGSKFDEIPEIRSRLNELSMRFSDEPAFHAFLQFQRNAIVGESNATNS